MDYLPSLQSAVTTGGAVAVVGTGVSRALSANSPAADWVGLIEAGITKVALHKGEKWAALQRQTMQAANEENDLDMLLGVASLVGKGLKSHSKQLFSDWLKESVGTLEVKKPALAHAIGSLGIPLLTTNYDGLLEAELSREPVLWQDQETIREIFKGESPHIGHIHGHWKHPDSIVFTNDDYQQRVDDKTAQFMQSAHYASKSFIFIGYGQGLEDPNFGQLRTSHSEMFEQSRTDHFRLCLKGDFENLERLHAGEDIRIVEYGERHEDLEPFLRSLVPLTPPGAAPILIRRDSVAYAREAILDQIRSETVVGDHVENVDDRELDGITIAPVLLPLSHDQFVSARSLDEDLRPKRIDASTATIADKIYIVAGEELSGVTTAIRWLVSEAAAIRPRTAPIFVDARNCNTSLHPLDRQVRREALSHRLIDGRKDDLPAHSLAIDNLKPQNTREYLHTIGDILASDATFITIGCRQGDEAQIAEDLAGATLSVEVVFIGRLGREEVQAFAQMLAPNRPADLCDEVLRVVRTEHLPRTPFTVALLIILLSQGINRVSNTSETAVLDKYINLLLGRSGPFLDPRFYLDPQNREKVLAELAKEFVRNKKGAISEGEAGDFVERFFASVDWKEDSHAALESFKSMRLLRIHNNVVQFQQTSYLHLFAAKAAMRDSDFLNSMLADPIYYSPIIRHYAALTRNSLPVMERMKELLQGWVPSDPVGRIYGNITREEARELIAISEEDNDALASSDENDDAVPLEPAPGVDTYDYSSDADHVPFPLDDPSTWPQSAQLNAAVDMASRVVRDSDEVADLDLKSDVFGLALSRWGFLAELTERESRFTEVADDLVKAFAETGSIAPKRMDHFRDMFELMLPSFLIYSGMNGALLSRKLRATFERYLKSVNLKEDPYSALAASLFAYDSKLQGWPRIISDALSDHEERWMAAEFISLLARVAYEFEELGPVDETDLRELIKHSYEVRHSFTDSRAKARNLGTFDQLLRRQRKLAAKSRLPKGQNAMSNMDGTE
jgi:hypothetical protein